MLIKKEHEKGDEAALSRHGIDQPGCCFDMEYDGS